MNEGFSRFDACHHKALKLTQWLSFTDDCGNQEKNIDFEENPQGWQLPAVQGYRQAGQDFSGASPVPQAPFTGALPAQGMPPVPLQQSFKVEEHMSELSEPQVKCI